MNTYLFDLVQHLSAHFTTEVMAATQRYWLKQLRIFSYKKLIYSSQSQSWMLQWINPFKSILNFSQNVCVPIYTQQQLYWENDPKTIRKFLPAMLQNTTTWCQKINPVMFWLNQAVKYKKYTCNLFLFLCFSKLSINFLSTTTTRKSTIKQNRTSAAGTQKLHTKDILLSYLNVYIFNLHRMCFVTFVPSVNGEGVVIITCTYSITDSFIWYGKLVDDILEQNGLQNRLQAPINNKKEFFNKVSRHSHRTSNWLLVKLLII